ncbi:hypothetical protein B0T19DRAFT_195941 [Cercophora scortea]|uniref:Uncharacterized protein n=1 Tax=Cercophora scortea TaxID=314031 RepID=A0AAE0IPF0_9PEZI|nr:hypothetical protein B0T19DRAFT_195941 [Cercophora scortea]
MPLPVLVLSSRAEVGLMAMFHSVFLLFRQYFVAVIGTCPSSSCHRPKCRDLLVGWSQVLRVLDPAKPRAKLSCRGPRRQGHRARQSGKAAANYAAGWPVGEDSIALPLWLLPGFPEQEEHVRFTVF